MPKTRHLVAGLAAMLAVAALPSTAFAQTSCTNGFEGDSPNPYTAQSPFAFAYPNTLSGASRTNLPSCRKMGAGSTDTRPEQSPLNTVIQDLEGNPADSYRKRWQLVDSHGQRMATITQYSDYSFRVEKADGSIGNAGPGSHLLIKGVGCMDTDTLESQYMSVVLIDNDHGTNGDWGMGAFMSRSAPLRDDINNLLVGHDFGCGGTGIAYTESNGAFPTDQFVTGTDEYVSENRGDPGVSFDERAGAQLDNYNVMQGRWKPVMIASTGVSGGGIVRAWVDTWSRRWTAIDYFGYLDPNAPCGKPYRAQWVKGVVSRASTSHNRIVGLIPYRNTGGAVRWCDGSSISDNR